MTFELRQKKCQNRRVELLKVSQAMVRVEYQSVRVFDSILSSYMKFAYAFFTVEWRWTEVSDQGAWVEYQSLVTIQPSLHGFPR